MNFNIGMVSLGCAKNQTDAETMLAILQDEGYKIVSDPEDADAIIVNTCGFIDSAKQESINTTLEMAQYKTDGKCKLLIMTGCLAERYAKDITDELPEVDAVLGTGDYDKIAEIIKSARESASAPVMTNNIDRTPECALPRVLLTPPYTAYLKIADGCDNNCTYCAIPKIRGHFRSRKPEDIISEAKSLRDRGVKELILIAQDTTRYGTDIGTTLAQLLDELAKIDGIEWIRAHYYYTEAITKELIDTMAKYDNICNYIDMPIQHADNYILRRMARRTTIEEIEEKIAYMRKTLKNCYIRTSIIVGFPGETEEHFKNLYDFVKRTKFDRMGVFTYSCEEGTPAAEFDMQIPEDVKEQRYDALMSLQQGISLELNQSKIGTVIDVIVEGYDEDNFLFYGRSRGDSIDVDGMVYFGTEDEVSPGDIIKVKILDASEYDLTGQRV
ncbi:MAG: 30S ribosomal protein S12 methylthiotransferase RimO [Clostridiales bacterium]|nr:30S ribosomal protein S12 methylthiotransferase RimO [Clostridiales bacterium]